MILRNARFCNPNCAGSFSEDRRAGAIYPAIHTPEGAYSQEVYSLVSLSCAFCGAPVAGRPKVLAPTWPKEVTK